MCGIFGYINYRVSKSRSEVIDALLTGLGRLEYRGYDSAGVCFDGAAAEPFVVKAEGNIEKLTAEIGARVQGHELDVAEVYHTHAAIAHTRWATHGVPSPVNSHPQVSDAGCDFVCVHNGIITNYQLLKDFLVKQGVAFESETDTEVIPKLCKYIYDRMENKPSFSELISQVLWKLEGAYALLFKSRHYRDEIIGCRCGSPLLLGIKRGEAQIELKGAPADQGPEQNGAEGGGKAGEAGVEFVFASDASAIVEHTNRVMLLEDYDIAHVKEGTPHIFSFKRSDSAGKPGPSPLPREDRVLQTLDMAVESIMKNGFDHFMQKEIYEQPEALVQTMRGRVRDSELVDHEASGAFSPRSESAARTSDALKLGGLEDHLEEVRRSRRIIFIACGTSFHACLACRQIVEELAGIPVTLELASDFIDRQCPLFRDDTCFFVSQSGETADTLQALRYARQRGALCVGVTNTVGSSISRLTSCGVHVNAGCEIGVASTKAYTCQIAVLVMVALKLSEDSMKKQKRRAEILDSLLALPLLIKQTLEEVEETVKALARELVAEKSLLVFGRGYNYATALEVALKVKEVTLMHSEGILAGELKHGPLALIDEHMPAVVIATRDQTREKMWSTIHQLLARKGRLILLVSSDDQEIAELMAKAGQQGEGGAPGGVRIIKVETTCDCLQAVVNIVPFQLLSYHLTILRGFNVDQPRNLAKSVTVE